MAKPSKYTRYQYRKSPQTVEERKASTSRETIVEETEKDWIKRLEALGITMEQIDAFLEVRSLEAFVNYCRDQGIELADIAGKRLTSNRA